MGIESRDHLIEKGREMRVEISAEFEAFAREQISAGHVASEEEAVANALRDYLDEVKAFRELVEPELASLQQGNKVDGPQFMNELVERFRASSKQKP